MATELETGLPSVRYVQTLIKDGRMVTLQLLTNEKLEGKVLWQDSYCVCLMEATGQTIVWKQAIAFIRANS